MNFQIISKTETSELPALYKFKPTNEIILVGKSFSQHGTIIASENKENIGLHLGVDLSSEDFERLSNETKISIWND